MYANTSNCTFRNRLQIFRYAYFFRTIIRPDDSRGHVPFLFIRLKIVAYFTKEGKTYPSDELDESFLIRKLVLKTNIILFINSYLARTNNKINIIANYRFTKKLLSDFTHTCSQLVCNTFVVIRY